MLVVVSSFHFVFLVILDISTTLRNFGFLFFFLDDKCVGTVKAYGFMCVFGESKKKYTYRSKSSFCLPHAKNFSSKNCCGSENSLLNCEK